MLVGLIPSNQSLWIDEGYSIPYVQEPNLGGVVHRLAQDPGSESLMPLAMISTWAGARVFGRTELGLRAFSALWAAMAVVFMWGVGRLTDLPWLPTVFACHPFLWYYGGEARPYAILIGLGAGLLYGGARAIVPTGSHHQGRLDAVIVIAPLLCGANVLGAVPVAIVSGLVLAIYLARRWRPSRGEWTGLFVSGCAVASLGLYYVWAVTRGAETVWRGVWAFRYEGALFSVYEILGFMGFGPGRYELRHLAVEGGIPRALEGFVRISALGSLVLGILYVLVLRRFISKWRHGSSHDVSAVLLAALVAGGTTITVTAISFSQGSPIWGRHLAAILPCLVFAVVAAANPRDGRHRIVPDALTTMLAAVLLVSSLMVRYLPQHGRDDYRSAARLAHSALEVNETVWWVAAPLTGTYYGLNFCNDGNSGEGRCTEYATNAAEEDLRLLPIPDLILMSKPEVFDRYGAVRSFLRDHEYRPTHEILAFQVFEAR